VARPLSSHSAQVGIDKLACLIASAGHKVAVAREGLLDSRVPHELLDRLRVDPGVDQQRREGMAALVDRQIAAA
jgi:hypothetical protein